MTRYAFFLLILFGSLVTAQSKREKYSSEECQSLGKYVLGLLKKKHVRLAQRMAYELTAECSSLQEIAEKAVTYIGHDLEISQLAAKIIILIGAHLDLALQVAFYWQRTEIAQNLIEHGANLYGVIDASEDMESPELIPLLHYAIRKGYKEGVRLMLSHGYDVDSKHEGVTPLMIAAWYGESDIIKMLLEAGADPDIQDSDGNTAFDYAFVWPSALGWSRVDGDILALLIK